MSNQGGTLVNREQFIKASLLTTTVFLNAAAFLRIDYEDSGKSSKHRHNDDTELAEPLDNTRIHPEDYDLARKMATDALELDEEDVEGEHPSYVVSQIMQAEDRSKKLSELNLDDFAVNMFEVNEDRKRHTLDLIRQELSMPFSDHRDTFPIPTAWDVLTMLTGQTPRSLNPGLIVSCQVVRVTKNFSVVRLDSGIEGRLDIAHVADIKPDSIDDYVKKGEMRNAVVVDLKMDLVQNEFGVEVSVRPGDLELGDIAHRRIKPDKHWDYDQLKKDQEMQARKKRAEVGQQKRIIKHPQFHDFNSVQAEAFLSSQQRGDAVIRSSSRGINHLAVTWKVDDKLYQHIGTLSSTLLVSPRSRI
jgi:transcription elongation factor SPT6